MYIAVINGPNMNMLGIRQPEIYGHETYEDLKAMISREAEALGVRVSFFQSNHEGALVDAIQQAYFDKADGIIINPAAYTHTSVALLDAVKAVGIPTVEVHISDVSQREAFRQGADIHRATASRLYQLPPEEVTPRMRSSVKAVNFGILYGKGAFSLSRDLGVSVKEADDFIKAYLGAYPKVKEYMDNIVAEGMEKGYVTTLYGRRRMLPELSSSNRNLRAQGERMALNTPIQGTAADIIKLAMVRVANRLEKEGLAARLILQVHDELIVECPESEAELAARLLKEEMESAASLSVPLTADVNQGKNWLEAH